VSVVCAGLLAFIAHNCVVVVIGCYHGLLCCREPRPFPKLTIDPTIKDIDAFRIEHLTVEGYDPHPTIKMDMAV